LALRFFVWWTGDRKVHRLADAVFCLMRSMQHRFRYAWFLMVLLPLGAFAFALSLRAFDTNSPGVIYVIELYRTNEVAIHANSVPFRTTRIQFSDSLGRNAVWSNLGGAFPAIPGTNHLVVTDTRFAPQRFYRVVTN
jgi:hypothetical protein